MAPAETLVVTNAERRRSERWPLALPLVVRGVSLDTKSFQEETFTLSVSAHGALVAMSTTVTLGQTIFLRNPQTQDEAGAWVTRLGLPRGRWAQVGIEFVRPNADFWSNKPGAKTPAEGAEERTEEGIHVLPLPEETALSEGVPSDGRGEAPQAQTTPPDAQVLAALGSPDILLHALEQTLQQAAEQAVTVAATARLGAAVNHAAAAVENFSRARMRQLEERLEQYRQELAASAHQDFLSQVQADIARIEEQLRKRAEEFIEDAARNTHGDFAGRLRETANQETAQFVEGAKDSSVQHFARLAEQIQAATSEARGQIETTAAGLSESLDKARGEMERGVAETRQCVESLTSQVKEAYADWEGRLCALREELAHSKEQEVEHFRERLRSVLTNLLASLG